MTQQMQPNATMIAQVQPLIPALRRYARALLREREAADDLVQDVLERAIARWHQQRKEGSVRAWLFAILHNLAMDRLRQRARRGLSQSLDAVPDDCLAVPAPQEMAVERSNLLARVAQLPEEQRTVLLLIAVEELSYMEAAAVLGIPQGTVMSRLSRARERLRAQNQENAVSRPALKVVS